jgi:hypothetical protein
VRSVEPMKDLRRSVERRTAGAAAGPSGGRFSEPPAETTAPAVQA